MKSFGPILLFIAALTNTVFGKSNLYTGWTPKLDGVAYESLTAQVGDTITFIWPTEQIQNICIQRLIVHILIKAAPGAIYTPGPAAVGQPAATPTLHFNVPPPSHFPLPPNFPPGSFFGISRVQKSCIRRQQCCGL